MLSRTSRRGFLKASAATAAGGYLMGSPLSSTSMAAGYRSPNEQPVIGFIGTGIRYHTYLKSAMDFGPCAALSDVDALQAGRALQVVMDMHRKNDRPLDTRAHEDYRNVLDRKDIDAVVIGTVDHWHSKIAIDAMLAGKDVYCEKPLTLTIREGQQILEVLKKTKRVFQVGTQQRCEFNQYFVKAAAMLRENRVGKLKDVTIALGPSRNCFEALPVVDPPKHLNWDLWQGQCEVKQYREEAVMRDVTGWGAGHNFGRAHRYYRWFYEYSGGKMTDWGAHHIDIALWAMNKLGDDAGKIKITPVSSYHPVPLDEKGIPTREDWFNTAVNFQVDLMFDDGVKMRVCDVAKDKGFGNGIMFEGDKGRYLVNRGKLVGAPVEALKGKPLDDSKIDDLYASGKRPSGGNMACFMDCIKSRETPSSDVQSHHKAMNVCHAINVALRLDREVVYDTKAENFGDDALANSFIERQQRKGFEIKV